MSLAALAIRACTVLALWRRTPAADRVADSELVPVDKMVAGTPLPFLTVATDSAEGPPKGGRSLIAATEKLTLVIEAGLGVKVTEAGLDDEGDEVEFIIPDSGPGLEWSLDFLTWRVTRVLSGPEAYPWGELWRRFVHQVHEAGWVRSALATKGARAALRQIVYVVEPISDPDIGRPPTGVWGDFIAALRAIDATEDVELAAYHGLADVLDAAIRAPAGLADWQVVAARLGATVAATEAIGITPAALVMEDGEPELAAAVTLAGEPWPEEGLPLDEERGDEIAPEDWVETWPPSGPPTGEPLL